MFALTFSCILIMSHYLTVYPHIEELFQVFVSLPSLPHSLPLPPLFLSQCQQYREQASVLENQPTGTYVLQVHAVDADEGANGKVKYGLMHRDSTMPAFRIHADTGSTDCLG